MSEAELQELVETWQRRLRLQDWRVKAKFKRGADMDPDKAGTISWNRSHKEATLSILLPEHHPEQMDFPKDVEETVIHELLHIHLATFSYEEGKPEHLDVEQAIVAISQALLALKRAAQPEPDKIAEIAREVWAEQQSGPVRLGSRHYCPNCGDRVEAGQPARVDEQGRWECRGCGVWTVGALWRYRGQEQPDLPETENTFQCVACKRILPKNGYRRGSVWAEDGETRLGDSCRECFAANLVCLCGPHMPGIEYCAVHNPDVKARNRAK